MTPRLLPAFSFLPRTLRQRSANAYFNLNVGYLEAGNLTEAARLFSR
jgi:hypothetical protein